MFSPKKIHEINKQIKLLYLEKQFKMIKLPYFMDHEMCLTLRF